MKWFAETHGPKFELVRHFLARMLDGEWSSTPGQWQNVVVGALALLMPAGLLLVKEGSLRPSESGKYRHLLALASPERFRSAALADELALLTLVFAVTGLIALIQWQSFFPGGRDYLSLAGLPVTSRQIFIAKFGSVVLFSTALVIVMNVTPSIVAPLEFGARWKDASFPAKIWAQAITGGLGCFFILFAIIALQGALLNTLSGRLFARISVYAQSGLIGAFLLAGLYSWSIRDWSQDTIDHLPTLAAWAPPVWFAGLHERMLGDRDPFFQAMANRALMALLAAVSLAVFTYFLSYRRYRRLLVEDPTPTTDRWKWRWSPLRWIASDPRQFAALQFFQKTMARSRSHRVIWLAYVGAAVGVMLNSSLIDGAFLSRSRGWGQAIRFLVLFWPLGTSVILLTGMRHVLSIPAELPANWIFRLTEAHGRRAWMSAVELFVILYAVAPIYVALFPLSAHYLGWPLAARMTLLQTLVSLTIFEVLFDGWQQLPFTCSYTPGKRPLISIVAGYIAALGVLVPILSLIIRAASEWAALFPMYLAIFGGVWIWLRKRRLDGWGEAPILYEDLPDRMPDLGIGEMGWGASRPVAVAPEEQTAITAEPQVASVALSLRLYRTLARAFPQEFQNAYGDAMIQMTEDSIEDIWRRHGAMGLARLLLDIAIQAGVEHLAEIRQDVRYGLRMLAASPGFAAVASISLGLGIGIGTSAYSVIHATILRDVPGVRNPGELITLRGRTSYPNYRRYRQRADLFASTLAYAPAAFGVALDGGSERVWGHLVTTSYFSTLGVRPVLGRVFEEGERDRAVVVSYRFWQDHLGADSLALGKTLRINGQPCSVIGVGPKDFLGPAPLLAVADIWMPLSAGARAAPELANDSLERRDAQMIQMVGRLKPRVSVSRAQSELEIEARRLEQAYGDADRDRKGQRVLLVTGGRMVPIRPENLPMLLSSPILLTGLMLLIACTNVASVMLARAAGRRREIAVRLALGASRARLIRQLLTESMLIALAAGGLGFLFTIWLMRLFFQSDAMRVSVGTPYPLPMSASMAPDLRVLLFAMGLAILAGLAFGLAPAFRATRADLTPALKEGGVIHFRGYRRLSLRNMLMLAQVGGAVTLLLLAVSLALGYQGSMGLEVGFDPRNMYMLSLDPVRDGYGGAQSAAFFEKLLEQVKRLPSVTAATLTDTTPLWTPPSSVTFSAASVVGSAEKFVVGKNYFDTLGVPILLGRNFRAEDEAAGSAVIVNEVMMRDFWRGENPLGRRIEIGPRSFQVVGVTRKTKVSFVLGGARPAIYFPLGPEDYARTTFSGITLIVRTVPGTDGLTELRREVSALDPRLVAFNAFRMTDQIDRLMFVSRIGVYMHGFMGVFGLILASVGLAGMTAYSVAQRGKEIGIRIALGAGSADVLGLVMKEGAVIVALGSIMGIGGAWAGARVIRFLMQATSASTFDPALVAGAPLALAALTLLACYIPARKSLRIDPVVALREE